MTTEHPPKRLLAVFAHPDDEVFCAGGTMATYASAGAAVTVLSATRGEAGQIRDASVATRATIAVARERELRDACGQLGVTDVRFLDHVDGTLGLVDGDQLLAEVLAVLDDVDPDVVITFGPDGLYGHPDHVAIGAAATTACALRPRVRLFHSWFPRSRLLLVDRVADWLVHMRDRFQAPADFARAFSVFATETSSVGFADDHVEVEWYPPGVALVEQGEASDRLFLILSGEVDVSQANDDGTRTPLRRMRDGEFFGELGIASGGPRTADVIAVSPVTCLVFARRPATAWDGRGDGATLGHELAGTDDAGVPAMLPAGATVIDVRPVVDRKLAALAAHRSQYPIDPEMFPTWLVEEMMGHEWFVQAQPTVAPGTDLFASN